MPRHPLPLPERLGNTTDNLDDNATLASAVPTRPSAQAAGARTSGSGSESAASSTGMASGEPQLPSATQTLRTNSARPDRRTADPREKECQVDSSKAVASNSTSSGKSVPGCPRMPFRHPGRVGQDRGWGGARPRGRTLDSARATGRRQPGEDGGRRASAPRSRLSEASTQRALAGRVTRDRFTSLDDVNLARTSRKYRGRHVHAPAPARRPPTSACAT